MSIKSDISKVTALRNFTKRLNKLLAEAGYDTDEGEEYHINTTEASSYFDDGIHEIDVTELLISEWRK